MVDVSKALLAKSDQLNSMDLIDPIVIQIDRVDFDHTRGQPIWIYYNKLKNPWKPSKGMNKIIASKAVFGLEDDLWIGKRLRIFNEKTVKYAGKEAGGVEISQVQGFDKVRTFPVRTSRTQKKFIDIAPLVLSDKEKAFFENLYGATGKEENLYLNAEQIAVIQDLLSRASWDISDFCDIMKVGALSEIGAAKFENLVLKLNAKISEQNIEPENTDNHDIQERQD